MRYSIRLAELVGHVPDPRKRPGTIKSIVEHTGLDRHQVAALLKNEAKYLPLDALSRICEYLIEQGVTTPDRLPGALFGVEPEQFWDLLARRRRLEICLGVRSAESMEGSWVVAADSVMMGELLNGISSLGGTSRLAGHASRRSETEYIKQSLVWSPGSADGTEVLGRASQVYRDFLQTNGDRGLIGLGSVKSNPVVELMLAETFDAQPFITQDDVASPADRACPFFLRYRDDDPQHASCSAGVKLAKNHNTTEPGIYYETADGSWKNVHCEGGRRDAAFVFYVHRESMGRLEMALGGFSGRATRVMSRVLNGQADLFWPPVFERHGVQVGAFVAEMHFANTVSDDPLRLESPDELNVIRLDEETIDRRLTNA